MSSGGAALRPTFEGHVSTTQDALILFEACLQGHLSHIHRRPHDQERGSLIRSGSVFIYEEIASGIKRWTDGVIWSPSRILGNFLVYRELDVPFPPGEKKRAMKKQKRTPDRPGEPYLRSLSSQNGSLSNERQPSDVERQLIGSLIDSYDFKLDGLVKKTMSVTIQGITNHLVSYYKIHDVIANNLRTPSATENLQYIRPRPELTFNQSFRSPIEEFHEVNGVLHGQNSCCYRMGPHEHAQDYRAPYLMAQYYPPMTQVATDGYSAVRPAVQSNIIQTPAATSQLSDHQANDYDSENRDPDNRSYQGLKTATPATVPPVGGVRLQPMMFRPASNLHWLTENGSPVSMNANGSVSYRLQS